MVSDQTGAALHTDARLVNSWGLAFNAEGLLYVADNGPGLSTLYTPSGFPLPLSIQIPPPTGGMDTATPSGLTFTPIAATLPDNAVAGAAVAAVSVTMSDGSPFSGSLAASPVGTVTMSDNQLVLARGLTPADDGSHQWSVSATQNGVTVSATIQVQVTPASGNQITTDDGSAILSSDDGSFFLMVS